MIHRFYDGFDNQELYDDDDDNKESNDDNEMMMMMMMMMMGMMMMIRMMMTRMVTGFIGDEGKNLCSSKQSSPDR